MRTAATLNHRHPHLDGFFATLSGRFVSEAKRLALAPIRFYRNRAQMTVLAGLSDHELSDVGLNRSDIIAASSLPTDIDPTSVLARIANERRQWRRGA